MEPQKLRVIGLSVLGLTFVFAVIGRGVSESFSVFLLPISTDQGWDRASVISIYSLSALCTGLAAPFVGRILDRAGPRTLYLLGLTLLGGALLAASHVENIWQLRLTLGLCVGMGIACIGTVPNSIMLGRWFGEKLPTAMAVNSSAMGAGVLVFLPLSQVLIDKFGWRDSYGLFGWATIALILPLALLPWRTLAAGNPKLESNRPIVAEDSGWTLRTALKNHVFWALFSTYGFTAIGMFAISPQVVVYLIDVGFQPLEAATAWGFSGVVLLFGMLGISWLDGIIGRRPSVLLSYAMSLLGIGALTLLQWYPTYGLLIVFVGCFGSMIGSRGPLLAATSIKIFRGKHIGTIYGAITIGSGLGAAIGSWCGGLLHDWTQGYNAVLAFSFVAVVIGMIPFLVVPALRR